MAEENAVYFEIVNRALPQEEVKPVDEMSKGVCVCVHVGGGGGGVSLSFYVVMYLPSSPSTG